jgi:hypothetical protein
LWVVYFAVVLFGIGLMALSVGRNVLSTPSPDEAPGEPPTRAELRACVIDLELLVQEQSQRTRTLAVGAAARNPAEAWNSWSGDWEKRLAALRGRCGLGAASGPDAAARTELTRARDAVLALHHAYSAQLNRFADEQRELIRTTAEALARAREELARAR